MVRFITIVQTTFRKYWRMLELWQTVSFPSRRRSTDVVGDALVALEIHPAEREKISKLCSVRKSDQSLKNDTASRIRCSGHTPHLWRNCTLKSHDRNGLRTTSMLINHEYFCPGWSNQFRSLVKFRPLQTSRSCAPDVWTHAFSSLGSDLRGNQGRPTF